MNFKKKNIDYYLKILKNLHKHTKMYDIHLHPFDIFTPFNYTENKIKFGLFSTDTNAYKETNLEKIKKKFESECNKNIENKKCLLSEYFQKRIYNHTGPYVFKKLFDQSFIHKGIMLPIPNDEQCFEYQMDVLKMMFSNDSRFYIAGSIPNNIEDYEIENYIRIQKNKYSIVAIKIHPNVTKLDLSETKNKVRLENIIYACSKNKLPIIIHGGRSKTVKGIVGKFGELCNFHGIKYDANIPIIIAHGGTHDSPMNLIKNKIIPKLKNLIKNNNNIFIDISGLKGDAINILLRNINIDRILFGSDSLYVHPLMMQLRFIRELDKLGFNIEECLKKVMNKNIINVFKIIN